MRLTSIGLIAFAIFFVPVGAKAAPCDPLNRESTVLSLDDQGDEDLSALALGFLFALTPAAFPQDQINAAANPCSRGEFVANNEVFNVFGEDSDVPPRWAVGHGGQIAYLAIMPPPAVTLEWARHGARGPLTFDGEPLYALALVDGDERDIFVLFEGMPGDAQLAAAFRDAIEGRLPRLATFNPGTGETQFADRQSL